jgi:hypothetical protein
MGVEEVRVFALVSSWSDRRAAYPPFSFLWVSLVVSSVVTCNALGSDFISTSYDIIITLHYYVPYQTFYFVPLYPSLDDVLDVLKSVMLLGATKT